MKNIFFILFILITSFGYSQKCQSILIGKISDFHDNTTLENATIKLIGTNKIAISDNKGNFKFKSMCDGTYTIEVSHIACKTKTLVIDINGDTYTAIELEHHLEELSEVNVKGKEQTTTKTAQETLLKNEVLQRYSSLSLGDALREVPGVSSINTGNTIVKPMINGLYGSRLLVINNNVRMQDQELGIEHAPNIDINSANQISVIKGSGALAYGGDAIGGVVVLNPVRVVFKDSLYGSTIINGQTNGRGFSVSSKLNKSYASGWFANIQGSLKQNGDFRAPDYQLTNTGLKSAGFSINAGKKTFESGFEVFYSFLNSEIGILRSSHLGNTEDLVDAINSKQPKFIEAFSYDINNPKQDVTHHLLKGAYYKRFKNFGKLNLQYDYQNNQRFEFDIRRSEDNRDKPALDLNLQTHTFLADVIIDANLEQKFSFGILGRYQNNFANPDTGVRRLIPDYDKFDVGLYGTTEWLINDNLTLDAGIRYDFNRIDAKKFYRNSRWDERGYDIDFSQFVIDSAVSGSQLLTNPIFNYHNVSASVGAKYTINDKSYFLFNYALSSRPPNPSELFSDGLHHSAARIELGDLRLDKEVSNRVGLTFNTKTSNLNFNVDLYYNRISNYMYLRPDGVENTIRGEFPVWNYVQTDATFLGIDLYTNYDLTSNWTWNNNTSFIKARDIKENQAVIDIPAFNTQNSITFNKPEWNNFSASLKSDWVFEQNEFPNFNFETTIATTGETVEVDISTPPRAYHLLHFYSEATFSLSKKTSLRVGLGINNLLDTTYREYLNRLRYFADDLGRNFSLQLTLNY